MIDQITFLRARLSDAAGDYGNFTSVPVGAQMHRWATDDDDVWSRRV